MEALADPSPAVRREAATALGRIADGAAVSPLTAALADTEPEVRAAALAALGRIRDPASVPAISRLLQDREPMVRVGAANRGSIRFVNCAFWGPCNQIARLAGHGTTGFSDCTFVQWDHQKEGRAALQVSDGTVLVRGCEFRESKPQIQLGVSVRRAVITDNVVRGKLLVTNESGTRAIIANNSSDE